jgi:hypothetical protein
VWQAKNQEWLWSTMVIGLWVGGDCTLEEIFIEKVYRDT